MLLNPPEVLRYSTILLAMAGPIFGSLSKEAWLAVLILILPNGRFGEAFTAFGPAGGGANSKKRESLWVQFKVSASGVGNDQDGDFNSGANEGCRFLYHRIPLPTESDTTRKIMMTFSSRVNPIMDQDIRLKYFYGLQNIMPTVRPIVVRIEC